MSFTASDQIDSFDHQAVRALFEAQARELALRDQRLAEKDAVIASRDADIAARDEKLSSRDQQIEHLKLLLAKMRRDTYGAKREKHERNVDQLELKLEELESDQASDEVVERLASDKPIKNKPVRKPPAGKACIPLAAQALRLGYGAGDGGFADGFHSLPHSRSHLDPFRRNRLVVAGINFAGR